MRILHIINDLSRNGGAQKFLVDLVLEHDPAYCIKILVLHQDNDYKSLLTQHNVECLCWANLNLREKWKILRWPNLIHSHLFPSIYLALLGFGKKKIQTEHCSMNRRREFPLLKFMEFFLYWGHNATVSISYKVQSELEKFMPFFNGKYRVIYNGVDLARFDSSIRNLPDANKTIRIAMVGRLHPYKDHKTLIKALALLPSNYELHLAGEGETKQDLIQLTDDLQLNKRIVWHGIINDIPHFLTRANIYVQSAHIEGFGLAAVEAMAAGLPVLSSNVPGLDEVIGKDQYLFTPSDSQELANKIKHLTTCQHAYEQASEYFVGRSQDFTIQTFRDSYYDLYKAI